MRFSLPLSNRLGPYRGLTYRGHSPYALDFNRGWGTTDYGDPVLAAAAGTVVRFIPDYGQIILSHGDGWASIYAHMFGVKVELGQAVVPGQILGQIGRTVPGNRYVSPHLHFQLLHGDRGVPASFENEKYPSSLLVADGLTYGPYILGRYPESGGPYPRLG